MGVGDGQGSLVCCSPWGRKESDMTEQLNRTDTMLRATIHFKMLAAMNISFHLAVIT